MKKQIVLLIIVMVLALSSIVNAQEKVIVATSIGAQGFIVEQIAGDLVDVEVMIKPGQEPHTFEVTPRQMTRLSKASLMFVLGFPFEKRLTAKLTAVNSKLKIIDSSKGIKKRMMAEHDHDHHGHDHHHGEEADPHTWLSPEGVEIYAKNIYQVLSELLPDSKSLLKTNLDKLLARNNQLAGKIKARLKSFEGKSFMVFHPSFGYFADYAGLKQVAIEAAGKKPSAKQMGNIIKEAKKHQIKVIFVQPQFDQSSAQVVAKAIGARLEVVDPLGADVFHFFEDMSKKLAASLGK
jgi:zinc transport system substrate-binding protein